MLKYEQKLEKVTETLDGLKADLKNKEDEAEQIEERIESTKEKIKNQEEEINDLKEEAKELKIKEKEGIDKIDQLKKDIKSKVSTDRLSLISSFFLSSVYGSRLKSGCGNGDASARKGTTSKRDCK